jgi:hypothetical protein
MNFVFLILLIATTAYALTFGGTPERIGAALYASACVLSLAVVSALPYRFRSVELGIFIVDVLLFVFFVLLALRANRFWPLWVSGLLGLGVLGHLAMMLRPQVIAWAYAAILSIWSYPILLLVGFGTAAHRSRLKRNGADPSWTPSSVRSGRTGPPPGPLPS